jgi:hypothetical protein
MVALHIIAALAMAPCPTGSNEDVIMGIPQMSLFSMVFHDVGMISGVVPS